MCLCVCSLSSSQRTCGPVVVSWTARGGATELCVAAMAGCTSHCVPSREHSASTHSSGSLHEHIAQVHTLSTCWCSDVDSLFVLIKQQIVCDTSEDIVTRKDTEQGFIQTDEK